MNRNGGTMQVWDRGRGRWHQSRQKPALACIRRRNGNPHHFTTVKYLKPILLVRLIHLPVVGLDPVAGEVTCRRHRSKRRVSGPVPANIPQGRIFGRFVQVLSQPVHAVARKDTENGSLMRRELVWRLASELLELVAEEPLHACQTEMGKSRAGPQQPNDALVMVSNVLCRESARHRRSGEK